MNKNQVRSIEDAFIYITDCNLATVQDLAFKKSRPKAEFQRQILIAQTAMNWLHDFKISIPSGTRIDIVIMYGTVQKYAEKYMPENRLITL